jgi:hypothetical protein
MGSGALGAAAEFDAGSWTMTINPDEFTHRPDVATLDELTPDEAGLIAMTVYHEARHAEQHFRVARLLAGEHQDMPADMDADAAEAAARLPLDPRTASPQEVEEARAWRTNEMGEDANYREAVTWWMHDALKATRLAHAVKSEDAAAVRERLGRLIAGWSKPGAAADYVHSHFASAEQRGASVIEDDITNVDATLDRVQTALAALAPDAKPADFKPLADALADLYRAIVKAYHDQPVEADAYGAGDAAFEDFSKTLGAGAR